MDKIPPYADIIGKYPLKGQAAIFLILESVNIGIDNMLPLTEWPPYDYDINLLVKAVVGKRHDDSLHTPVSLVLMDFRSTIELLPDLLNGIDSGKYQMEHNHERIMNYATMIEVVHEILIMMSKKTEEEVDVLLNDITTEAGLPCFPSIEAIADGIIRKVTSHLEEFIEKDCPE